MNRRVTWCLALAAVLGLPALASAQAKPFEFALYSPIQVRNPDDEIQVLRLSLIYGRNESVKGLDVGLVARNTGGVSKGLQYALVGIVDGDFVGWQNNGVSITRGEITGIQSGLYNQAAQGEVAQFGLVNQARDVSGFQLGLINLAENLYGVQIGLVNVISSKEAFGVLPLVNWKF
ncbi:MAG: hypothetical protein R3E98_17745 [Gemmatimonadota bacterium]